MRERISAYLRGLRRRRNVKIQAHLSKLRNDDVSCWECGCTGSMVTKNVERQIAGQRVIVDSQCCWWPTKGEWDRLKREVRYDGAR